ECGLYVPAGRVPSTAESPGEHAGILSAPATDNLSFPGGSVRSLIAWRVSLAGFALSAALLVGIAWTAFGRITDLDAANAALEHTLRVRNDAEGILSVLKDAETGQRGFLITGVQGYLDPYNVAEATLPG